MAHMNERVKFSLNVKLDNHLITTCQLPPLFLRCSSLDERRNMNGHGNLDFSPLHEILFTSS